MTHFIFFYSISDEFSSKVLEEKLRECILYFLQLRVFYYKVGRCKTTKKYSQLLEKTSATLEDIQHHGKLNSLDTLNTLGNKLPFHLRRTRVQKSVDIKSHRNWIANFFKIGGILGKKFSKMNSFLVYVRCHPRLKMQDIQRHLLALLEPLLISKKKVSSQNKACWYCDSLEHNLMTCAIFKSLKHKKRYSFV